MVPSTLLLYLAPAGPVSAAAVIAVWRWVAPGSVGHRGRHIRHLGRVGVAGPAVVLAAAVLLAAEVPETGPVTAARGLLRADALAVVLLLVIGSVAVVACWAGTSYLATAQPGATAPPSGAPGGGGAVRYLVLVQLFIATMSFAVLAGNLGVFWVALEATTVLTAFLVGHHRDRHALEAAWKYVVLCSGGIAMAFLGTVVLYAAAIRTGGHGFDALNWAFLTAHAAHLDPDVTKLAAGLLVLGFGTKAGLAPVHAWLPDAHSQAPAPVSALMSGALLAVAFSGILRAKVIIDAAVGAGLLRWLLVATALLSLLVAATLLLHQRDYKRMLAYSSVEHMGLVALGTAVGTEVAMAAVLLHIFGHGLSKAALFCGAGTIMATTRSSRIESVRGLAATRPGLAAVFGFGLIALLGLPPFSLFASELGIARAGFEAGLGWAVAATAGLLLVIFVAVARHGSRMLLGASPMDQYPGHQYPGPRRASGLGPRTDRHDFRGWPGAGSAPAIRGEPGCRDEAAPGPSRADQAGRAGADGAVPAGRAAVAPLALALIVCAALGVTLGPLQTLLEAAATVGAPR